ncbi:type VI secretion system tube protein Hcp [Paraglaciecola sp. 25GB23A]|uniref:Hcp family type VI secretion system effector n=1 Tax=Paraglaciecola sp. 25GB23A TaxID=3156068 RepID=UPI0032AF8F15
MKKLISSFASCITLILMSTFSFTSAAAVDQFLTVDGVDGDSQVAKHEGDIDILAWSWGSSSVAKGKGTSCNIQDVSITKYVDSASPVLLMGQLNGKVYASAQLAVSTISITTQPIEYIVIDFNNVRITSLSTGGSGGEDRLTENLTFSFSDATYTYTPPTGDGTPITATIGGC